MYNPITSIVQIIESPLFSQPGAHAILGVDRGLLCSYLTGKKLRRVLGHDVQHSGIGILHRLRFRYQPAQLCRVGLVQLVLVLLIVHAVFDSVVYHRVQHRGGGREAGEVHLLVLVAQAGAY